MESGAFEPLGRFAAAWPPRIIGAALVGSLLFLAVGCDADLGGQGPAVSCSESGVQCLLGGGPLGVCERAPCSGGEAGACFVCAPQH